eukprot:284815199_2
MKYAAASPLVRDVSTNVCATSTTELIKYMHSHQARPSSHYYQPSRQSYSGRLSPSTSVARSLGQGRLCRPNSSTTASSGEDSGKANSDKDCSISATNCWFPDVNTSYLLRLASHQRKFGTPITTGHTHPRFSQAQCILLGTTTNFSSCLSTLHRHWVIKLLHLRCETINRIAAFGVVDEVYASIVEVNSKLCSEPTNHRSLPLAADGELG